MAKSTVPRHSKTTRKPVTIDLDPSDVKSVGKPAAKSAQKTVPDAEPVGSGAQTEAKTAATTASRQGVDAKAPEKQSVKEPKPAQSAQPETEKSKVQPEPKPVAASRPASSAGVSAPHPFKSGNTMNSAKGNASSNKKSASPWLAGLTGGAIALAGAFVLQWSGYGFVAPQSSDNREAEQATAQQIAGLEQQIAALQAAAKPDAGLLQRLSEAEIKLADTQAQISALPQTGGEQGVEDYSALLAQVAGLQEQVTQLADQTQNTDAAQSDALLQRLTALEERMKAASRQAEQASAAVHNDDAALQDMKTQLAAMQSKLEQQERQPDMAAVIAADALKAAIDRGSSYENELQTYKALLPQQGEALSGLEAMAATGVPTLSALNTRFTSLADTMVAAVNKPAPDAGIWQQLVASAKGLVRSRPVGDVAGSGVGAVTARIEFALQNGDVQRALTQWAQLPEAAKQAGQDFYNALVARRDADALLAKLIAATTQPEQQPAAQ